MSHIYDGSFTDNQMDAAKEYMRKQIFFLLLCVDPKTKNNYSNVNVETAFDGTLRQFGGLNELLSCPPQLVRVMELLQAALMEYKKPDFQFARYKSLVLTAGNEVLKIEEVK